jgi:hypothetical protein
MSGNGEQKLMFMELYLNGQASPQEIDDYVGKWHTDPGMQEIYEFLGMSEEEYSLWLRDPNGLPYIAHARKEQRPLDQVIASALKEKPIAPDSDTAIIRAKPSILGGRIGSQTSVPNQRLFRNSISN